MKPARTPNYPPPPSTNALARMGVAELPRNLPCRNNCGGLVMLDGNQCRGCATLQRQRELAIANDPFPQMITKVPPGVHGKARIDHGVTSLDQSIYTEIEHALMNPRPLFDKRIEPGRFARLWVGKDMMMTDTRPERLYCLDVVEKARGDVLIAGLGLGMILWPIAAKPEVRSVRVIEKSADVIALVGPHLPPEKVRIVHADAFSYRPRKSFQTLFFDIWPHVKVTNLIEMDRLHKRYARFLAPGGWMESWHRTTCLRQARHELRVKPDLFAGLVQCGGIWTDMPATEDR